MFSTPVRGPGSFGMQSPVPGPGGSGGKGDGSGGPRGGWYGFGGSIPAFASPLSTLSDADGKYDRGLGPLGSGGRRAARRRRAEGEQAGSLRGQFASRHQTQALAGHQAAPGLHGVPGVFRPLRSQVADSLHRAALQQPPPRISAPTGSATVQPGAAGHASATTSGAPAASAEAEAVWVTWGWCSAPPPPMRPRMNATTASASPKATAAPSVPSASRATATHWEPAVGAPASPMSCAARAREDKSATESSPDGEQQP